LIKNYSNKQKEGIKSFCSRHSNARIYKIQWRKNLQDTVRKNQQDTVLKNFQDTGRKNLQDIVRKNLQDTVRNQDTVRKKL